MYTKT